MDRQPSDASTIIRGAQRSVLQTHFRRRGGEERKSKERSFRRNRTNVLIKFHDRALELYEKGIKQAVIAERLGVRPTHVGGMLQRARQRREKLREKVG